MGLEVVEFQMAVEESFGVSLPDDAGARFPTLDDFRRALREYRGGTSETRCASQMVFHGLRRALVPSLTTRHGFRPATPLLSLSNANDWHARWKTLATALDLRMPPLQMPAWARAAVGVSIAGTAAGAWAFGAGIAVLAAAAGATVTRLATRTFDQPREATVAELVAGIVAENYGRLLDRGAAWSDGEALRVLKALASAQLGVPLHNLTAETALADLCR